MITVSEYEVKSLLTKTRVPAGDYVINPYAGCPHKCLYCYADYMKRFAGRSEKWGDFLGVKHCAKNINLKTLFGKKVILSSVTDAYNPFERKYKVTQNILKQFAGSGIEVEVLTKSDLILRDINIFKSIPRIRIGISLNTLDEGIRKDLEPRASPIEKRLNAIKTLTNEGIDTYIFLSPIFPGITDFREILSECKTYTGMFYFENLNLRGAFRAPVLAYIQKKHSHLMPLYEEIYTAKNTGFWKKMENDIDVFCAKNKIKYGSYFYHEKIRK
ncbi:MAG: radical SAM protein [Spirochaetales bacterium]|jgi:DNA repair photolyase|nr:radical SAM protein [Spirochaetales bacterium]